MTLEMPSVKGVYFYFHNKKLTLWARTMTAWCLAEGLKQLGVPAYSNIVHDLFITDSIHELRDYLYVFVITDPPDSHYDESYRNSIVAYPTKKKVILSIADDIQNYITPPDIPSFMTHENRFFRIAGDRRPWGFGYNEHVGQQTENGLPPEQRKPIIMRNFRPTFMQGLRNVLDISFVARLERYITIDRSYSDEQKHFEKLKTYLGCLAYGGDIVPNFGEHDYHNNGGGLRYFFDGTYTILRSPTILRWDSYRFWESLAAGCLTFHVDFNLYGFELPVNPVGWQHYIPIDISDPKGTVEHFMDEHSRWGEIAEAGKAWTREHYSPAAVAKRFLYETRNLGD